MQESLTSKYDMLLSFRYKKVIISNLEGVLQSVHQRSVHLDCNRAFTYFFRPQLSSTQKGRTLVPSAMLNTYSSQSKYRDVFFSIYTCSPYILFYKKKSSFYISVYQLTCLFISLSEGS